MLVDIVKQANLSDGFLKGRKIISGSYFLVEFQFEFTGKFLFEYERSPQLVVIGGVEDATRPNETEGGK
jgi:hypothetical protein